MRVKVSSASITTGVLYYLIVGCAEITPRSGVLHAGVWFTRPRAPFDWLPHHSWMSPWFRPMCQSVSIRWTRKMSFHANVKWKENVPNYQLALSSLLSVSCQRTLAPVPMANRPTVVHKFRWWTTCWSTKKILPRLLRKKKDIKPIRLAVVFPTWRDSTRDFSPFIRLFHDGIYFSSFGFWKSSSFSSTFFFYLSEWLVWFRPAVDRKTSAATDVFIVSLLLGQDYGRELWLFWAA